MYKRNALSLRLILETGVLRVFAIEECTSVRAAVRAVDVHGFAVVVAIGTIVGIGIEMCVRQAWCSESAARSLGGGGRRSVVGGSNVR